MFIIAQYSKFFFKQIIWLFNPFNSYVNILFFLKTHYFFQLQLEDKISRHKARVTSTLDRLAHQVAVQKKERADKCRAFKVRLLTNKLSHCHLLFVGLSLIIQPVRKLILFSLFPFSTFFFYAQQERKDALPYALCELL